MRFTISGFILLSLFFSTPGFAQVKRWTDKDGVVHLEGTGPKLPQSSDSFRAKRNALRPIERNFATLRLGDDESPFTAAKKALPSPTMGMTVIFIVTSAACPRGRSRWECSSTPEDWR